MRGKPATPKRKGGRARGEDDASGFLRDPVDQVRPHSGGLTEEVVYDLSAGPVRSG